MKVYDQKGSWGVVIALEQIDMVAYSATPEEDDFTVELLER